MRDERLKIESPQSQMFLSQIHEMPFIIPWLRYPLLEPVRIPLFQIYP